MLATPDHPAYGMGMFHRFPNTMDTLRDDARELPYRARTRLRQPWSGSGRRHRARRSSRGTARTCCRSCCPRSMASPNDSPQARPSPTWVAVPGGALLLMAGAFPNSRFLGYDISQYRAAPRRGEAPGSRRGQRVVPRPARRAAARRRVGRVHHDVRLHPRHDPSVRDDADAAPGDRPRRHVAARRHQGARHVRAERIGRTRWHR